MRDDVTPGGITLRAYAAEEVRALLGRRRISATQLAKRMSVSQAYVWRRLAGETAFDLDDLEKIAGLLDAEPADLLPPRGTPLVREAVSAGTGPHPNGRSLDLTVRPWLNGHPSRTSTPAATRRPARIGQVNTRPQGNRPMPRSGTRPAR